MASYIVTTCVFDEVKNDNVLGMIYSLKIDIFLIFFSYFSSLIKIVSKLSQIWLKVVVTLSVKGKS